mgnify:CR=1 FL=1
MSSYIGVKQLQDKIIFNTLLVCNDLSLSSRDLIFKLASACAARILQRYILRNFDEVYREFIYTDSSHYSVLQNKKGSQHAVMIDSVSKRYSLCGARVGCMISKRGVEKVE